MATKGSTKPKDLMSTQVLLASSGLAEFFKYFDQAGHGMFDSSTHAGDLKVEQIILEVEAGCGITFTQDVRIRLWKALRYQWFRGPGHSLPFIERVDVPSLTLPPVDWIETDSKFKFSDLESDRQRQVMRKIKQKAPGEVGQSMQTFQFEVYRRSIDLIYEFSDLERCVQEWERRNPRNMVQEDQREEVMRMRLKSIIDHANSNIATRRVKASNLKRYSMTLLLVQVFNLAMCILMLVIAINAQQGTPPELMFSFVVSSKQFVSASCFFMASVFANVVSDRRKADPLIRELRKTVLKSERLIERISDFRISTEDLRMSKQDARKGMPGASVQGPSFEAAEDLKTPAEKAAERRAMAAAAEPKKQEAEKEKPPPPPPTETTQTAKKDDDRGVRHRKEKKKKEKKDRALALWAPDAGNVDDHEIAIMQKQLAQSYKRPQLAQALPDDWRRPGGDRMSAFQGRLGGVKEDELCVRVTTGKQKKRQAYLDKLKEEALAKIPKNPPPPMLALQAHAQSLRATATSSMQAQTIGRDLQLQDQDRLPLVASAPPAPPPITLTGSSGFFLHPARDRVGMIGEEEETPLLAVTSGSGAASSSDTPPMQTPPVQDGVSADAAASVSPYVPGLAESEGENPV
eukprot:TRINITY_DN97177_c0_g1_i1.p1 TRINITY_DN97177_c0_g1~~TRINITY_DN97177_c0_g1_i1.p1  ORF type:complete len:631 (+),score=145.65 TRINITY_DN97177_c0_g1_i1:139-2031(+)